MRNKGHVFGVRTFKDSKNTLLGTCPEISVTLNRCLFRKKESVTVSEHFGVRIFRVNTVITVISKEGAGVSLCF